MFETILRLCDNCDKWLTMNISNSFTVAPDVTVQVSVVVVFFKRILRALLASMLFCKGVMVLQTGIVVHARKSLFLT